MLIVFVWANFYWIEIVRADDDNDALSIKPGDVIINEVMWMGSTVSYSDEWIELKNTTDEKIAISDWKIENAASGGKSLTLPKDAFILPNEYFLIANYNYKKDPDHSILTVDPDWTTTSISLSDSENGSLILKDVSGNIIDEIEATFKWPAGCNKETSCFNMKQSMERSEENDWHDSCEPMDSNNYGTPKKNNSRSGGCDANNNESEKKNKKSDYADMIKINEIYSSPDTKAGEKEFIEVINVSRKDVSLKGWTATDEKNKGKPLKDDIVLEPDELYIFEGSFGLNQNGDAARILDEKNNLVDYVQYENGKARCHFAFDGSDWRWTSRGTPGEKNKFDPDISAKIKKDKSTYANTYAYFSVITNGFIKKIYWAFGDGHGSTLKDTRHKYTKAKKYSATLTISGVCEQKNYDFKVEVKKFEAPKIRIVKIDPNPEGSDTEKEWIEIENKSKKNVNLQGWSIATGWDNLVNHPIREGFKIKKGKTKKLMRDICAFTLNNSKTKIELRDPSGKVVQKIQYDRGKDSVEEEELFLKEDGANWKWIKTKVDTEKKPTAAKIELSDVSTNVGTAVPTGSETDINLGKYTANPVWENRIARRQNIFNDALLIGTNLKPATIEILPRVLGARVVRENIKFYSFTQPVFHQHWAAYLTKNIWEKINTGLSKLINNL